MSRHDASPQFDPYYVWLGIPPKFQPPDHYRLLGIEQFESDPKVINSAADRQMAHVRTFQAGKNSHLSQKLLNELSAARGCLLNPGTKSAYDKSLAAAVPAPLNIVPPPPLPVPTPIASPPAAVAEPLPWPILVANPSSDLAPIAVSRAVAKKRAKPVSRHGMWLIAGGAPLLIVVAVLVAMSMNRSAQQRPGRPTKSKTQTADTSIARVDQKLPERIKAEPKSEPPSQPLTPGTVEPTETKPSAESPPAPSAQSTTEEKTAEKLATATPVHPKSLPPRPRFVLAAARPMPAPNGDELRAARKEVREQFGKELVAANKPLERFQLAQKMFDHANSGAASSAQRFVLVTEASKAASEVGQILMACNMLDWIKPRYRADTLLLKADVLDDTLKSSQVLRHLVNYRLATLSAVICLDEAEAAEQYELAERFARLALALSKRVTDDRALEVFAQQRLQQVLAVRSDFERMHAALDSGGSGDDAQANLAVGRYLCFVQGKWEQGLPLLANCADAELAHAAQMELAKGKSAPHDVAEAWWQLSQNRDEPLKSQFLQQARYWYEHALPNMNDSAKAEARLRIVAAPGVPRNRLAEGLLAEFYSGPNFGAHRAARIDRQINWKWHHGGPDGIQSDVFSARWGGWLRAPIPGKYRLVTDTDDGVRLWIDDKLLIEHWGRGAARRRSVDVDLTAGLHAIRYEFQDILTNADASLSWSLAELKGERIVPGSALLHDPRQATAANAAYVAGDYAETLLAPQSPEGHLLCLLEDRPDLIAALFDGPSSVRPDSLDRYSGEISLKVDGHQRFAARLPGLAAKIRENPAPGEFRFLRFAWKKSGGQVICLQIAHNGDWGNNARKFRYDAGSAREESFGGALRVSRELPTEWTVVTRDLFADFGEFSFTGLALAPMDGAGAWFDHMYLARSESDFKVLGAEQ